MNTFESSVKALVDIAMTFFPEHAMSAHPDRIPSLQTVIEKFLLGAIPFDLARELVSALVGNAQPLEKLKGIIDTDGDPIPMPDEFLRRNGVLRHKTRPWSSYEDQRLLAGIYRYGIENWTVISKFVGNARTRSQCSQRWYRGLDPTISKVPWSKEEEDRLVTLIAQFGDRSWTAIASRIGNRSDVQCRYKYRQIQKEKAKEGEFIQPPGYPAPLELTHQYYERPAIRRLRGRVPVIPFRQPQEPLQFQQFFGAAQRPIPAGVAAPQPVGPIGQERAPGSLYEMPLPPLMVRGDPDHQ
jgi:hypothetical protein